MIAGPALCGQTAIITGAGSSGPGIGNGKAAAILFARAGARLVLVDRSADAVHETARMVADEGISDSVTIVADVTRSSDWARIATHCRSTFGTIDILLNNVGIERPADVLTQTEAEWDLTLAVNLKSVFLGAQAVLPTMIAQRHGAIVNIASINAVVTLPALSPAYSASKAAVIALGREIAIAHARDGIRCNAVLPGMMATPMVEGALTGAYGGDTGAMHALRDAMCPSGKQGSSWDTAAAALFLASPASAYVNGASLVVDGGLSGTLGRIDR